VNRRSPSPAPPTQLDTARAPYSQGSIAAPHRPRRRGSTWPACRTPKGVLQPRPARERAGHPPKPNSAQEKSAHGARTRRPRLASGNCPFSDTSPGRGWTSTRPPARGTRGRHHVKPVGQRLVIARSACAALPRRAPPPRHNNVLGSRTERRALDLNAGRLIVLDRRYGETHEQVGPDVERLAIRGGE
jgi:hypothetical protein